MFDIMKLTDYTDAMEISAQTSPHLFHIPVMGTGFSIDTPLRVAKYGISSVVSIVDDILIEQMRKYHCDNLGLQYIRIPDNDDDRRANRITAYLDLLNNLIHEQVKELQSSPFVSGSNITRYFEMLPDSKLKESYLKMLSESNPVEKSKMQDALRPFAKPGSIDVNIMTKVDSDNFRKGEKLPPEFSDALAALRGYANSSLQSSIILSAGINQRLFGYLAKFEDFFPDKKGQFRKGIILKVSDYRSGMIQGKYLARRGLWVSEYRIESGLNCGGHAFPTEGFLMGPILEEFGCKKAGLVDHLHEVYNKALSSIGRSPVNSPPDVRITVQGGIGTADENKFLMDHYEIDGTGWGTPFLLVPEVTNVDDDHLKKLLAARDNDVYMRDRSPLGVPFWSLLNSSSEKTLQKRIDAKRPGSPCTKGFLKFNTEFTKVPICRASRSYQKRKLEELSKSDISSKKLAIMQEDVMAKSCLCQGVSGCATLKLDIDPKSDPAVCCGPNIVNFGKVASLEEMVDHIYGRLSLLTSSDRPHMFIKELSLYVDYFRRDIQKASEGLLDKTTKRFMEFKHNLNSAIEYYQDIAEKYSMEQKERFLKDLDNLFEEIEKVFPETGNPIALGTVS